MKNFDLKSYLGSFKVLKLKFCPYSEDSYQANLAVKLILNYFKRSTKWRLRQLSRSRHFRGLDFPWQASICPQGVVFGNYPYRHMWHRLRQIKSPNCKIWWVSAMFQLLVFLQFVNTGPLINLWMMFNSDSSNAKAQNCRFVRFPTERDALDVKIKFYNENDY